jgi:hypothetical protein
MRSANGEAIGDQLSGSLFAKPLPIHKEDRRQSCEKEFREIVETKKRARARRTLFFVFEVDSEKRN